MNPSRSTSIILDVGGFPENWTQFKPCGKKLDILNVDRINSSPSNYPEYNITTIKGDGCNLKLEGKAYDIVFSNSVIEHVGSWENQKKFASEAMRVGKSIWIQTPAKEFFIEPHYITPFIHWLPKSTQKKLLRNFTIWGWVTRPSKEAVEKCIQEIRLISKTEMQKLFPDCKILKEKFLRIFTKSYIAYRKAE